MSHSMPSPRRWHWDVRCERPGKRGRSDSPVAKETLWNYRGNWFPKWKNPLGKCWRGIHEIFKMMTRTSRDDQNWRNGNNLAISILTVAIFALSCTKLLHSPLLAWTITRLPRFANCFAHLFAVDYREKRNLVPCALEGEQYVFPIN